MALFDQIVSAISNPNQQASTNQLGSILSVVQQLSGSRGMNATTTQLLLSVVGRHVRSALQQKRSSEGNEQAEAIVNRFSGTQPNLDAVRSLFSPAQQQETVRDTAQKTGLNTDMVQSLLPLLVPVVLNLLQSGASNQAAASPQNNQQRSSGGVNSVLSSFLDSNQDGDIDIGGALSMASRFLNQSR